MMDIKLPPFTATEMLSALSEVHGWQITKNKIPKTWDTTKGEGVVIWVLDTGLPNHEDLDGVIIGHKNFVEGEPDLDENGHETAVCGVIAAQQNDMGIVGVAPKAQIFVVKVLNKNGAGSLYSIMKGLEFAKDTILGTQTAAPKPNIICMSLGSPSSFPDYVHGLLKTIVDNNVVIVCAAGNSGKRGVDYPAAYEECIAVAAYGEDGKIGSFSAIGEQVDFAAPGVKIYTTFLNNKCAEVNGTSFAAPFLCGVIALMLSKHQKQEKETGMNDCKTPAQVVEHLIKYSIDVGDVGKDKNFGYGIINIEDAILAESSGGESDNKEPLVNKPKLSGGLLGLIKRFFDKFI